MIPYQFASIRYVHNIATEEFVNIGIVLWTPNERKVHYKISTNYGRLSSFFDGFNSIGYQRMIKEMRRKIFVASRDESLLQIADIEGVLHHLMPAEDGCFQWSEPMSGVTRDAKQRVDRIYQETIGRHEHRQARERQDDAALLNSILEKIEKKEFLKNLTRNYVIQSGKAKYSFKFGWQNGKPQVMEPISLDYVDQKGVIGKAERWIGRLYNLQQGNDFEMTGVVVPPQDISLVGAFDEAVEMLKDAPKMRSVINESELESFFIEIEKDIQTHQ
jgi:Protein of unknown function (DUF3037)